MPATEELAELVEAVTPRIVELRRRLHTQPEPAYREFETTRLVRAAVERSDLVFRGRAPKTGGWVDTGPNPSVAFRADLDGLPIREPEENSPRSAREGWMHACGHDAHTAIAAGIALTLDQLNLDQGVRVVFQPAEEANPGGAVELMSEGVLDGIEAIMAFHVDPTLRTGRIGARVGPITSSADSLTVTLHGPGGHTSRPHKTIDLVEAASRVVVELPNAIRQTIDARSPVVVAFGSIHGGDVYNVIPTEVVLRGTVRTLDVAIWDMLPGLVDKSLSAILSLSGAGYTLNYQQGIPPVINDRWVTQTATEAIARGFGNGVITETEQSMGGEDFSNYLVDTPGVLLRLGSASGGGDLHSAGFNLNEEAIGFGIHAGTTAILGLLSEVQGHSQSS